MRFKYINKINSLNGFELNENRIYSYLNEDESLVEYSLEGVELWKKRVEGVYFRYYPTTKYLIYNTENNSDGTFFFNRATKKLAKKEKIVLNITNHACFHKTKLYSFKNGIISVYDFKSLQVDSIVCDNIQGIVVNISEQYLVSYDDEYINVYNTHNFTPLWQADVSELCGYELQDGEGFKKAEINNVLLDGDKVIVLAGLDVVAFDISNGDVLWQCKVGTAQSWGVIHGQFIYTTSNGTFNKIDLKTGNVIYQREFEYIHINGEKKGSAISDLVWHNDFIWIVMDTSPNALLAIDPKTGRYVEVIPLTDLGITSDCRAPVFHHGKMYLHDYNGTLHIFEEENVNT